MRNLQKRLPVSKIYRKGIVFVLYTYRYYIKYLIFYMSIFVIFVDKNGPQNLSNIDLEGYTILLPGK